MQWKESLPNDSILRRNVGSTKLSGNIFQSNFLTNSFISIITSIYDFSDDNTWEPVTNLTHCKKMVEEFEEQLKKLKAEKAKQQQQLQQPPPVTPQSAVKSRKVANATTPLSPTPSSSSSLHEISGG